jgi:hypothetical protein
MSKHLDLATLVAAGVSPSQFPAVRIQLSDKRAGPGCTIITSQRPRTLTYTAPGGAGSYAVAVRLHERLHALHSFGHAGQARARRDRAIGGYAIAQCAEDVALHSYLYPANADLSLYTALVIAVTEDARSIRTVLDDLAGATIPHPHYVNAVVLLARAWGIAFGAGTRSSPASAEEYRDLRAALDVCEELPHAPEIARAARLLSAARTRRQGVQLLADIVATHAAGQEEYEDLAHGAPSGGSPPVRDSLMPIYSIAALPLTIRSRVYKSAARVCYLRSGARIRAARLAVAVAARSSLGVFRRLESTPSGTVLIDSSGSMRIDCAALTTLCNLAPAATVAYYAGFSNQSVRPSCIPPARYGAILIAAQGGLRFSGTLPKIGVNNEIDLYAVQWLLRQAAPRMLVTDGRFCGGPEGQSDLAAALVDAASTQGRLTVVPSVREAPAALRRFYRLA